MLCQADGCCDCADGYTDEGYCRTKPDAKVCDCEYTCNGIGTDCSLTCNDNCGDEFVEYGNDSCDNNCPSNSKCDNGVCYCNEGYEPDQHCEMKGRSNTKSSLVFLGKENF